MRSCAHKPQPSNKKGYRSEVVSIEGADAALNVQAPLRYADAANQVTEIDQPGIFIIIME